MTTRAPVVLGGYPAKRCARAVHNAFSPTSPPQAPVDEATQQLFDAGNEFEARVNERLGAAQGAVLLSDDDGWDTNIAATVTAMRAGVPLIVNGRLPRAAAMVGAPDVLVRLGDGYVPVDVKLHGTARTLPTTRPGCPAWRTPRSAARCPGCPNRSGRRSRTGSSSRTT